MGLDDFITEEKTSSPKNKTGGTSKSVDEFVEEEDDDELDIEGGFSIDLGNEVNEIDTEVVKIFGGPGTGKTTTIVGNTDIEGFEGILEQLFDRGMEKEVMLLAYTRAAADEAKDRLSKLTDTTKAQIDRRVTTIHSTVMQKNNLGPQDIVEIRWNDDKKDFCDQVGLEYDPMGGDNEEAMMATPDDEGHLFFRMNSWLKSKLKGSDEWEDCPLASEWTRGHEDYVQLSQKWEEFKDAKGLWEFDDAILESVNKEHTLDTKQLFIDEVQDLYPLQQAFIDNQFGHVERIYLAGDDDQTIYEWAGAKPEYFLNMEPNMHDKDPDLWGDKAGYWDDEGTYILDQSWRMPSEILELAKMTITQVDNRQDKQIKPHHDGGEFIPLHSPDPENVISLINPDDTMILFRAKYQMQNFGQELIKAGIPFKDRFKTWRDNIIALRNAFAALHDGDNYMSGKAAQRIVVEMPGDTFANGVSQSKWEDKFASKNKVDCEQVLNLFRYSRPTSWGGLSRWCEEFEEANYYQTEAVKHNIHQGNQDMEPDGIRINTIHGSKGREADTVILSTDTTQSVKENMDNGEISDAERRLYYVGMTRTENRLVMCQGLDRDSPEITLDEIISPEWRDKYEWANGPIRERRNIH